MVKGKNFSLANTGKRRPSDFYETPYTIIRKLLENHTFTKQVLEPACGDGAIVKVLEEYGYKVTSYDKETNFLLETRKFHNVITNPPFSLAYEFINKCAEVCTDEFALLLPLSYLHGKKRYDAFYANNKIGLRCVYVLTRYPLLGEQLREDGKYNTGMMVYAWFVFSKNWFNREPIIRWIDNDEDVLRK
jgi:hypothetical protein